MTTLTITHTSADGTLLEGSTKGDGAWEAIKAAQAKYTIRGWRYMPSIRMVGVSHSRDRAPMLGLIDRTADVLRAAGFDVTVEIDGTPRAMEQAEAERADRMDERADALQNKAERKAEESEQRFSAAWQMSQAMNGQPILVGHHSERRHRRDIERIDTGMRKSSELHAEAQRAEWAAESAARHMEARTNPRRVYRRIRTQEAELRGVEREMTPCRISGRKMKDGNEGRTLDCPVCYRSHTIGDDLLFPVHGAATGRRLEELEGRKAHLTESIRYWTEALEAAKAAGADVPADTAQIEKGYWVKSWAGWCEVTRVNKVSVTVRRSYDNPNMPADHPGQWFAQKITLDDVREIRATSPYTPAAATDLDATV